VAERVSIKQDGGVDHHPPAPARSADAAYWIAPRLTGSFGAVVRTVPSGFEAYARVFHPADPGGPPQWLWGEVAAANNRTMHAGAQWARISTTPTGEPALPGVDDPALGDLDPDALSALVEVLARHTAVRDCWFAMWQGWDDFYAGALITASSGGRPHEPIKQVPAEWNLDLANAATFTTPGRDYFLFTGPLADATRFGSWHTAEWYSPRSPNLFWPDDRSWCVASEIDFDSTLVGGSSELIADLAANEVLEAWPINPDDSLAWDADTINRPAAGDRSF
jgi:hypothetical protein